MIIYNFVYIDKMPSINSFISKDNCNNTTPLSITVPPEAYNSSIALTLWIGINDSSATGNNVTVMHNQLLIYFDDSNSTWNIFNMRTDGVYGYNYSAPYLTILNINDGNDSNLPSRVTHINIKTNKTNNVTLNCFYTLTYSG